MPQNMRLTRADISLDYELGGYLPQALLKFGLEVVEVDEELSITLRNQLE